MSSKAVRNHVVLVFERGLLTNGESFLGALRFNQVVGPFTEQEADEYIPNPAPKGWEFVISPLEDGNKEFQG